MIDAIETIRRRLFEMQDADYRAFQRGLMPTVDVGKIIGVRIPQLRAFARELKGTSAAEAFLTDLPHAYYEEDNLHAFLIESIRDCGACIAALEAFLPFVDNWATCDMMGPKALKRDLPRTLAFAKRLMASEHTYSVRYGIGILMRFFLDDAFDPVQLEWVAALRSQEYYVNMMIAWYFATALAKQWTAALPFIQTQRMEPWIHNKAIQKAVESLRVTPEQKTYLKMYRISGRKESYPVGKMHR